MFVLRRASQYTLNPRLGIIIDAARFDQLSRSSDASSLESAARLYQGRYFENEAVEQYFMAEGQYYHEHYLRVMDLLIQSAMNAGDWEKALNFSKTLLSRDVLWEPAYRSLMVIHHAQWRVLQVFNMQQGCPWQGSSRRLTLLNELAA